MHQARIQRWHITTFRSSRSMYIQLIRQNMVDIYSVNTSKTWGDRMNGPGASIHSTAEPPPPPTLNPEPRESPGSIVVEQHEELSAINSTITITHSKITAYTSMCLYIHACKISGSFGTCICISTYTNTHRRIHIHFYKHVFGYTKVTWKRDEGTIAGLKMGIDELIFMALI